MEKYLIAHDLGTTGNKATLFSTSGKLIKSINHSYNTHFFNGNWAEQNPHHWWEAVCDTNKQLLEGIDKDQVEGLAFSGQMMGCVCVDKNGQVLRDAIIWADQRSIKEENFLRSKIDEKQFYEIVGHKISASYSIEKLMWIRDNEPHIFKDIHKMLNPKDYIIYRLTGSFLTDYSDASGTNAFDIVDLKWSERILECAEIDIGLLPEAYPSTHIAGTISSAIADECGLAPGTKVVIGGGDGVCASVGAGSVVENSSYNYLGSSSWISYTSKNPVFDPKMRTFNWVHIMPGFYAPTGTMQAAGNSLSFMKKTICDGLEIIADKDNINVYDLINEQIASSTLGANGLLYLPYLLGERSPRWNPNARGAFIGLKMEHTKADMLRATIEGILMNLDIILQVFKKESDIKTMNIIGGMAKGAPIRQILSDIYGLNINRLNYLEEATSMGAAVTAGVGVGVFKDFNEIENFIKIDEEIFPNMVNHKEYEKIKRVFDNSYTALLGIYDQLSKI